MMKTCRDCRIEKDYSDFHKKQSSSDGLQTYCKLCMLARNRSWAKGNRRGASEATRRWRAANPERIRVDRANARARALDVSATLTLEEWLAIVDFYGGKCAYCDQPFAELDHVVPLDKGGGTTKENVVPACKPCNRRKHAELIERGAYQRGYERGYADALQEEQKRARSKVPAILRADDD